MSNEKTKIENRICDIPERYHECLRMEELYLTEDELKRSCISTYNIIGKRCVDFIIAISAFIVLIPAYLVIAALIVSETGFPILYRPERGGYKGKTFRICKFRTMIKDAEKKGGSTTALNDSRITRVGAILRKTKLDELPQILNVITGKMSFVGPRPELLQYTEQYQGIEKSILSVRPGITDFSSVTFINLDEIVGRYSADLVYEQFVLKKKNQLRLKYVAEVSFRTDVRLLYETMLCVAVKICRVMSSSKFSRCDKNI